MRRIAALLTLAGALGLLGAACGGDGGGTGASSTDTETATTATTATDTTATDTTATGTTATETTATDTTATGTTGTVTSGNEPLDKEDYERLMREYGADVGIGLRDVFEATTPEQTTNALAAGQLKLRRAATRMDKLVPPTEVAKPHDRLVQGIRLFADDLARAEQQFEKGNVGGVTRLAGTASLRMLQTAYNAIVKKGYDLDTT
jgi:hypothetical protein